MHSMASGGGDKIFYNLIYKSDKLLDSVSIEVGTVKIDNIRLKKIELGNGFTSLGNLVENNGLSIGASKYVFRGNTYISLWSDQLYKNKNLNYLSILQDGLTVTDLSGKEYKVYASPYSGNGREYYIEGEVNETLIVTVENINIDLNLNKDIKLNVQIPDKGEEVEINKEIYIEDIDKYIMFDKAKGTEDSIELLINTDICENENINIFMLLANRKVRGSCESDYEKLTITIDRNDLSLFEKISGKINFDFERIDTVSKGTWILEVE